MTVPTITLNDGTSIPQLGFGVFQVPPTETAETVTQALEVGYRHIDTAQMYSNEAGVGEAHRGRPASPRDELYVTTKLNNGFHRPDDARRAFDESLEQARPGPRRPVPHPLAAAHAVRRRLRLDLATLAEFVERRPRHARSASPTSSPPTSTGSSTRPASCRR